MPRLSLGLGISSSSKPFSTLFSPTNIAGLSLWLKADAGVSNIQAPAYNYVSQIIISGTSTLSGTYTATSVPSYEGYVNSYSFSGPSNGFDMYWNVNAFVLESDTGAGYAYVESSDGQTWAISSQYFTQVVISGFTGIYAGANGTYTYSSDYEALLNGDFLIDGNAIRYIPNDIAIAYNTTGNYAGAWTPTQYFSTITLSAAGTTSINGIYTRSDSQIDIESSNFTASSSRSISYDDNDNFWFVGPNDQYRNYNQQPEGAWVTENGDAPAPTAVYGNSERDVGNPVTTSVTAIPSGSIIGSITTSSVMMEVVSAWADQSGNSRNFTKSIDNTGFPTFSNGALLFTANNTYGDPNASILALPSESLNLTGPYTLITLVRAGANNSCVFSKSNDDSKRRKYQIYVNGGVIGSLESTNGQDTGISYGTGTGDDVNIKRIIVSQFTSDSSGLIRYNGAEVQVGTGDNDGYGLNETNSASVFIGASPFGEGSGYNAEASTEMYVYEIIFYNRAITTSEIQEVEAYLMDKYAIAGQA